MTQENKVENLCILVRGLILIMATRGFLSEEVRDAMLSMITVERDKNADG